MIIPIEISSRRIADMFVCAIEHNSMTTAWCSGLYFKSQDTEPPAGRGGTPWYDDPAVYEDKDLKLEVLEIEDEGDPSKVTRRYVDQRTLVAGLVLMAAKHSDHFADMVKENDDAVTADVFLQCVALGEVKYG